MEAKSTVGIEKDQDTTITEREISSVPMIQDDSRYYFNPNDLDKVQRRLKQRHIQMCVFSLPVTYERTNMTLFHTGLL